MRLERDFKVTSDQFFDHIEKEFVQEVEKATSRKIKPKDMKAGFKYTNRPEGGNKIVITVLEYVRGEVYSVRMTSGKDSVNSTYHVTETEEGIHVAFDFEDETFEKKKEKYGKIKKGYQEVVYYNRMSSVLYGMITAIEKEEQGIPKEPEYLGKKSMQHISGYINDKLFNKDKKKNETEDEEED